ncbi:ATP-binding cassette domain-containing protein [Nakamurella sp. YIM 132087]|uniref:ATP-binding cassette domain-containing protein n=1 Tax=Nakamurella alba TaxID=2665158 RepID=A0A7K1FE46_9ACTN|nr:ABC transporter ATP-binding protein [Nakamurella alba]MTD12368.1 ATP-binding cassette domain-containing protein [Nakamurella alba]
MKTLSATAPAAVGPAAVPTLQIQDLEITAATGSGTTTLVEGFTLSVAPGEIVGLIGESGSGKTTIARSIIGLLDKNVSVSGGSIGLNGTTIRNADENHTHGLRGRSIGMVFQNATGSLDPLMRIGTQLLEVVRVVQPALKKRAADELVRTTLADMGFADVQRVMRSYPHQLSGGMNQRVAIALAVVNRPALIIADEATSALDVTTQAGVVKVLQGLAATGISLVFVTHDLLLASEICDRIAVLEKGRLVELDNAVDLVAHPREPYTKALLDAIPNPHEIAAAAAARV